MKIGDIIKAALAEGKNTAEILALVKAEHPDAQTTPASIAWYRSQAKKAGPKAEAKKPTVKAVAKAAAATAVAPTGNYYTVRGIKNTTGMEGSGYIASLYRDGDKVADVADYGDGGCVHIDFLDYHTGAPRFPLGIHGDYTDEDKVSHTTMVTPEYKLLYEHCRALPKEVNPYDDTKTPRHVTMDCFIDDLVNDVILLKQFKNITKKLAYLEDGAIYTYKAAPTQENIDKAVAHLKGKGRTVRILNGISDEEALKVMRATQGQ